MRARFKIIIGCLTLGAALAIPQLASADPITCPPGQAAVLNPSDGGWVCVNSGGNLNNSEQTTADDQPKDKF